MKQKPIQGLEKYSDKWVALDSKERKVIVGGKSLKNVIRKATKIIDKPVYMRVPPLDVSFSPSARIFR